MVPIALRDPVVDAVANRRGNAIRRLSRPIDPEGGFGVHDPIPVARLVSAVVLVPERLLIGCWRGVEAAESRRDRDQRVHPIGILEGEIDGDRAPA